VGLARGGGCQAGLPIPRWDVGGWQEMKTEIREEATIEWVSYATKAGNGGEEFIMNTCLT
jgi:hypothetical protein